MASSSLSVTIPTKRHNVFVSFRGEDTRNNFTSHLVAALRRKQMTTFVDDRLIKGDEISPSLVSAIEGSDISVVVFSKQYSSSRWCLDELVKILECKNNYEQIVIPVFYHVDPSHVRKQTGIFGESFSKLQERFQDKLDKLESWKTALRETANLSGFHVEDNRPESDFVEEVANNVLKRLNEKCRSRDKHNLIGVESIITTLELKLITASTKVYTLGIWGVGGIGKTTIATAIFKRISPNFEGSCLIQNVREREEKIGLDQLKEHLFSSVLGHDHKKGNEFDLERLKRKKALVVFDDVTRFNQIEYLIESLDSFGDGSRIIITTRDRKVLDMANVIYEMKGLLHNDALTLFSQYGFRQNHPIIGFEDLSMQIIYYCCGVPLALKLLGCFLYRREKEGWESQIEKLKNMPHQDIQKVLKISYDGLDPLDKLIFLDIVCFFKGRSKDYAIECLDACGFSSRIAIEVLEEKCLIIILDNIITMHDLMQEMGKEIIRQESIDYPEKRSRLWHHEDIYEVLTCKTGTKAIQGISFNMFKVEEIRFALSTFQKMRKLRFLEFYGENNCKISHYLDPVFFELRVLHWNGYPLESLPFHLHPEYLCSLRLRNSKIKTLWDGNQNLHNLKHIDLSFSKQLEKLPDLKSARILENLILEGCSSLVEIDLPDQLNKLVRVDVRDCESLKSLPPKIHSESLNYLLLSGCTNLMRFPDLISCSVEELDLDRIGIEELPSSIECLSRLFRLNISNCSKLKRLPTSICQLKSLWELRLSDCPNLQLLPENLGHLEGLCNLYVERTPIREVPFSIGSLQSLKFLNLSGCFITELPESLGHLSSLEKLCLSSRSDLQRLPNAFGNFKCSWTQDIERTAIRKVQFSFGSFQCLKFLKLSGFPFTELPESLGQLSSLERLCLSNCSDLQRLPDTLGNLKRLTKLNVKRTAIREVPSSIVHLHWLQILKLSNCKRLRFLPELPKSIEVLTADNCKSLQALPSDFSIFLANQALRVKSAVVHWSNCFQLDQKKLSKIVEKDLQNIQRWETKWLKKAEIESWKYPPLLCREFSRNICYPGSEIPDWIDFRGMGSSGSVPLPRGLLQSNLIGVVVCAIITFADGENPKSSELEDYEFDSNNCHLWCGWEVKAKCGPLYRNSNGLWDAGFLPFVDSDHVTLCYEIYHNLFGKGFDESHYNNEVFIQFSTDHPTVYCSKVVKKWGIRFLYRQDFREFKKDFSSDGEEGANKELMRITCSLYRQDLRESLKDFISSDEEEGAYEQESKSQEKSNEVREEPYPKRLKPSTSSF